MRSLRGGTEAPIVRLGYQRNTVDVDDAVAQLNQIQQQALQQKTRLPIKAVIMVPTYRAAVVTQVVPALEGHSSLVLDYKSALAKYFPGEAPDYVSLEGYVDGTVLIAALKQNGAQLDTEKLVATFENLRDLDIGLGTTMNYSRSEHQGVHKVWGTQIDADGHYQAIDLQ